MPQITAETPKREITIAGVTFLVPAPYAAGHTLNDSEASALNQTYAENLRNGFANRVKKVQEEDGDVDALQEDLDAYASSYEFGVRRGGGSADPVRKIAMEIARGAVQQAITEHNRKRVAEGGSEATFTARHITELANAYLDRNPEVMEKAKEDYERRGSIAIDILEQL